MRRSCDLGTACAALVRGHFYVQSQRSPLSVGGTNGKRAVGMYETLEAYYRRDYSELVGLAYVLTGSRWVAEDLVQDALTEAHRKWPKIRKYDDPAGWVRRVLINKSISRGRRVHTEKRGLTRIGHRRAEPVEQPYRSPEVWDAVQTLPSRQAQAVALFYWEDQTVKEIGQILGVSTETAKTHLKRGRRALAGKLDSHRRHLA